MAVETESMRTTSHQRKKVPRMARASVTELANIWCVKKLAQHECIRKMSQSIKLIKSTAHYKN